jgi:hypothetical protein
MKTGHILLVTILLIGFVLISGYAVQAASGCTTLYDGTWKGVIADSGSLLVERKVDDEWVTTHNPFTAQYDFEMTLRCAEEGEDPDKGTKGWSYDITHVKASHPVFDCANGCTPLPRRQNEVGSWFELFDNGYGFMVIVFTNGANIETFVDENSLQVSPDGKTMTLYIKGGTDDISIGWWCSEDANECRIVETDNCERLAGEGWCSIEYINKNTIILNKIEGASAGQTQPAATQPAPPTITSMGPHPLPDFGSDFQPLQISNQQADLIQSGMQSYNSECKGRETTPACKKEADELISASHDALQLQDIATADDPKAIGAWESAQTADWTGPEMVDLANLHMENGDQVGAAVIALQAQERAKIEAAQEQARMQQQIEELKRQAREELARDKLYEQISEHLDTLDSATYKALSYDLDMAVNDIGAAHAELFKFAKAIMLSDKDTSSKIFNDFIGVMFPPAQAGSRPSK